MDRQVQSGPATVGVDLKLKLTGPREPELRAKYST